MKDPYLNRVNVVNRLHDEWATHGKLIIAYDFDHTVYDYNNEDNRYDKVINLLRECREVGAHLIVFTSRSPSEYEFVENYLLTNDIPYDKINENIDGIKFDGRKVYYNILLDDRAGLESAYYNLDMALTLMK